MPRTPSRIRTTHTASPQRPADLDMARATPDPAACPAPRAQAVTDVILEVNAGACSFEAADPHVSNPDDCELRAASAAAVEAFRKSRRSSWKGEWFCGFPSLHAGRGRR